MGRQVLFGSYELLERIGEGGMAEVWRARSRGVAGFEKEVVIKRVLPSLMAREDFAELLIHEAKVAARLNHPGIVQIFELGEEQGAYFIAMELVQGCDLATALAAQPNPLASGVGLSLPLRLWIMMESARALDYAHRQRTEDGRPLGIVHRDISPQNVLLGYEGQVKVADFGIALAQGLGSSEDGNTLRGKYAYMSPEQARAEPLDNRSDIFSLGIVLYELLAGKRLFRAKTPEQTLERVVSGSVPVLDFAALGLPAFTQGILERALERDRESRYPSAGLMADDLSRVLVEMEAHVGDADLREAIARIAPPADASRANKARITLFTQTDEERLGHGDTPVAITEATMAFSTSKRLRAEERAALVAVMPDDAGTLEVLRAIAQRHGGLLLPAMRGTFEVVFGHEGDAEHAAERAVRFGLDVRHQRKGTPLALLRGGARVYDGDLAEPLAKTRDEAVAALSDGLRIHPALVEELRWRFHIDESDGGWPSITEARSRAEREIQHLRDGPLVGRRDELAILIGTFNAAAEGRGTSVLVSGPAGTGKSRLIAELAHAATCEGATVLSAHGRAGKTNAYGALGSLFGDLCGLEVSDDREARREKVERLRVLGLGQRSIAEVASVLGLLDQPLERPFGRPRGLALAHAFDRAIQALSEDGPVVVVFEDVHWMDDETRQLLALLIRPLRSKRVLAVMSARPGVALPPLGSVETLRLERLEALVGQRLFARALGARAFEGEVGEIVERACEGNPAGLTQLAAVVESEQRAAIADGVLHQIPPLDGLPLPDRMASAVAARVSSLPKSARDLLAACAALGEHAATTTLAAITNVPVDMMRRPMMRLLTARWLRPIGGGGSYELTGRWGGGDAAAIPDGVRIAGGDLVRRCVLASLPSRQRQRLHASAVTALADVADAPAELLAQHARLGDLPEAADHCLAAAKACRADGEIERAAWWTLEAARAAEASGEPRIAWRVGAAELALEAGDPELVESALDGTERATEPALVVRAGLVRARLRARESFWSDAVDILEQAADVLEDVEDDALRGQLWLALGWSLMETGDVTNAIETLDAAVGCFEVAPPSLPGSRRGSLWVPEPGGELGYALAAFAIALARAGEDERAADASHRALVRAAAHGGARLRWRALFAAAEVASCEGAEYAYELWVDAATLARDLGMDEALAQTAVRAAVACVDAGRENEAAVWAAAAKGAAKGRGLDAVACLAETVQAELALAAHPDTHFVRGLVRSVERLELLGRAGEAAMGLDMLARAHLALGDVGAAIRTLGRAAPMADGAGRPRLASQLRARAESLARTGAR